MQPEDGSKESKHVAESCKFIKYLIKKVVLEYILLHYVINKGPGVAQRLRHCATSRAVLESNPGGVGHRDISRGYRQNHVPWGQLSL